MYRLVSSKAMEPPPFANDFVIDLGDFPATGISFSERFLQLDARGKRLNLATKLTQHPEKPSLKFTSWNINIFITSCHGLIIKQQWGSLPYQ